MSDARRPKEIASLANSLIRREATIVLGAASSSGRGDLIIVPAPFGSLGDDLLVRGVVSLNGRESRAASWRLNERWPIATDPLGGALLRQSRRHLVARTVLRRRVAARWDRTIYIGADTLDGTYGLSVMAGLDMVDHCATQGRAASVVGFSFSDSPRAEVVERIRRISPAVRFVARGSISAARFRNATGTPCAVSPDPSWGYLAAKELPLHHRFNQKSSSPQSRSQVVGINLGVQVIQRYGGERFVSEIHSVVQALRSDGIELVALPHDFRGGQSDAALLRSLMGEEVIGVESSTDLGSSVRTALTRCDVVLSCRMHLTIAALAAGVPVVAFGYQDKFEDLLADPDLSTRVDLLELNATASGGLNDVSSTALAALRKRLDERPMTAEELHATRARKLDQLGILQAAVRHEGDWPPPTVA